MAQLNGKQIVALMTKGSLVETTIRGMRRFNRSVDCSFDFNQEIVFTSNGTVFRSMFVKGGELFFYDDDNRSDLSVYQQSQGELWTGRQDEDTSAYRIVDFGTEPQTVTKDIYDWIDDNTTVYDNMATATFTENGTYIAEDEGLDGWTEVTVNVPTYITVANEDELPYDVPDGTIAVISEE